MNFGNLLNCNLICKSIYVITLAVGLMILPATICSAQENQKILSQLCVVQSRSISESSGVALSKVYENAIWTHNDSGNGPIVYLFSKTTGKTLAEFEVMGASNRDWEDISSVRHGEKNYLIVADTGDNLKRRRDYQLCIFTEPEIEIGDHAEPDVQIGAIETWKNLRFKYEDGKSHDCEAITANLADNQIILLEKVYSRDDRVPGVYVIQLPEEKTDDALLATRVADIKIKNITAMDMSPDGSQIVVRTYVDGFLFTKQDDQTWADVFSETPPPNRPQNPPLRLALPMQRQGEGVAFTADGAAIILSSEFRLAPLWQLELNTTDNEK